MQDQPTKFCKRCQTTKPLDQFWRNSVGRIQQYCIDCGKQLNRDYGRKNRESYTGPTVPGKACSRCKRIKFAVFFTKDRSRPDGLDKLCIDCKKIENSRTHPKGSYVSDKNLWDMYRLKREDWHKILDSQHGVCAICGNLSLKMGIDHCHSTGRVRGILCSWCNAMLSGIECPGFVERAQSYLKSVCVVDGCVPKNRMKHKGQSTAYVVDRMK